MTADPTLVDLLSAWWATLSGVEIMLWVIAACWLAAIACAPACIGENPREPDTEMESLASGAPASLAEYALPPTELRAAHVEPRASGPVCICPHCTAHRTLVHRGFAYTNGRFVGVN